MQTEIGASAKCCCGQSSPLSNDLQPDLVQSAHLSDSDLHVCNGFWGFFCSQLSTVCQCVCAAVVNTDLLNQCLVLSGCCCIAYKIFFSLSRHLQSESYKDTCFSAHCYSKSADVLQVPKDKYSMGSCWPPFPSFLIAVVIICQMQSTHTHTHTLD